jgi:hypothetical protein
MNKNQAAAISSRPTGHAFTPARWKPGLRITPRGVRIALGSIWTLDGLLQFQPYFFTQNFLSETIGSMASGQPGPIHWTIVTALQIATPYRVEFNVMFALTQLAIGAGLIAGGRWVKPALVVSFGWSFIVWWFGEGLGVIPNGMASPLTGAPGAVLIYALIGVIVWPAEEAPGISVASGGILGDHYARLVWGILWLFLGLSMVQLVNRDADAMRSTFASAASSSPGPFAGFNSSLASMLAGRGTGPGVILAVLLAVIGIAVYFNWRRNVFLLAGVVLAIFIWITAQSFGGMFTGQGSDPNSSPLLVLLALTLWVDPHPQLSSTVAVHRAVRSARAHAHT